MKDADMAEQARQADTPGVDPPRNSGRPVAKRPVGGARRRFKRAAFSAARQVGVFAACAASAWRRRRIAVICYHGVSIVDEHEWKPALYVRASFFRRRMEFLHERGYTVLGLEDAVRRRRDGSLPRKSVVLTFDDGTYDFFAVAWPILREFGYPATVYWTTYYAERPFPVFSVAYRYAQWKAGSDLPPVPAALATANGAEKNDWFRSACQDNAVPYELFSEKRLLTIMRPDEVAQLAAEGCDFQLHTHRHRMPLEEDAFRAEIRTNREIILAATNRLPRHFCYTSGRFRGRYLPWLEAEGVTTATTTQPGLVAPGTPDLLLPRLVDHEGLTETEFEAWISGVADLLPHRTGWKDPDSL